MSAHYLAIPGKVGSEELRAVVRIRHSVLTMNLMIRDLLEYTRTRLGKGIPITPAAGDLTSVCKHAFDEFSLMHPQTAFRFEAEAGLLGVFDAARMQQVVSNLLNNAVQHGRRGSPVTLIARANDQGLVMQVKNRGRPIAPEMLQVIFDPLVQVPPDPGSGRGGTNLGLGLFIARELVLAHGGTIGASSSGEETVFTIEIPRNAPHGRAEAPVLLPTAIRRDEALRVRA